MKKKQIYHLIIATLFPFFIFGQENTFVKIIGNANQAEQGHTIIYSGDGNYYVGAVDGQSPLIIKMSKLGNVLWERKLQGVGLEMDEVDQLLLDSEGKLVIAGRGGVNIQNKQGYVLKYDPSLNVILWIQQLPASSIAHTVIEPEDMVLHNYYIIIGGRSFSSFPGNGDDAYLAKINKSTGNYTSFTPQNYNFGVSDAYLSTLLVENELYACGRITNYSGLDKMRFSLTKMDIDGHEQWTKLYHIPQEQSARLYGMDILLEDQSIIVVGHGDDNGSSVTDVNSFVFKTDLQGELEWIRKYEIQELGGTNTREIVSMPDGFVIVGTSTLLEGVFFLLKINKEGETQWAKSYKVEDKQFLFYPQSQLVVNESSFTFIATIKENDDENILIIKTDLFGHVVEDCIEVNELTVSDDYVSNPTVTDVSLTAYDSPLHLNEGNVQIYEVERNEGGCISAPIDSCHFRPDVELAGIDVECSGVEVKVILDICNNGDFVLSEGMPITFYQSDPTNTEVPAILFDVLQQGIEVGDCITYELNIPPIVFDDTFFVVLNDDGSITTPFDLENDFPATDILECDYTNNILFFDLSNLSPAFDLGDDLLLCEGDSIVLDGGSDFVEYEWSDGSTESSINVSQAGVYWLEVTDACGIVQRDSVRVDIFPLPTLVVENVTICEGSIGLLVAHTDLPDDEMEAFEWQLDGEVIGMDSTLSTEGLSLQEVTEITLYYTYGDHCGSLTKTVNVFVIPNDLMVSLTATPDAIFFGDSCILTTSVSSDGLTYIWFKDGAEIGRSEEPTFTVINIEGDIGGEIVFSVEVTSMEGCIQSDETSIVIKEGSLEIPNVFTPNGDGVNDVFKVFYTGDITVTYTRIYNRWGETVFESTNNQIWDGSYKAKPAASDVYIYEVTYSKGGVSFEEAGEITLLR